MTKGEKQQQIQQQLQNQLIKATLSTTSSSTTTTTTSSSSTSSSPNTKTLRIKPMNINDAVIQSNQYDSYIENIYELEQEEILIATKTTTTTTTKSPTITPIKTTMITSTDETIIINTININNNNNNNINNSSIKKSVRFAPLSPNTTTRIPRTTKISLETININNNDINNLINIERNINSKNKNCKDNLCNSSCSSNCRTTIIKSDGNNPAETSKATINDINSSIRTTIPRSNAASRISNLLLKLEEKRKHHQQQQQYRRQQQQQQSQQQHQQHNSRKCFIKFSVFVLFPASIAIAAACICKLNTAIGSSGSNIANFPNDATSNHAIL